MRTTLSRKWQVGLVAGAAAAALAAAPLAAAHADDSGSPHDGADDDRPLFQMPFECGETWDGTTRGDHVPPEAIDFNGEGIDGEHVFASAPGTVVHVQDRGNESYGKVVFVEHDDEWFTTYAHLSEWIVEVGDVVDYGTVLGSVGATGNATGPQLHYEQRTGNHVGDPQEIYLDGEKVHYDGTHEYTSNNDC